MTRILRGLAVLGALMLAGPADASIVPVALQFDNPSWSGTVSFEDTTGEPWSLDLALAAFEIAGMTISDGVHTWTEDELVPPSFPPDGGLLVDANGRAALFVNAIDTSTGASLSSSISTSSSLFTDSGLQSFIDEPFEFLSQSTYIGFVSAVSVPSTLLLVASGLMGLSGVAWRRRR